MDSGCADYLRRNREAVLSMGEPTVDYYIKSSKSMDEVERESVELIVTSPPYPGVEMWEHLGDYDELIFMIHMVIRECYEKMVDGGIMCINIGDATKTVDGDFQLFSNHTRIIESAERNGFTTLVPIHWKKPTNNPNPFLGSGFHPPNAYVTNDTEYILIFRKGSLRDPMNFLRKASAYTKEERDVWFSQQWNIRGESQDGSATFPPEIPYRLIRMFSVIGDTVLDPFCGTGTTLQVARCLGRSAVGYEINEDREKTIRDKTSSQPELDTIIDRFIRNEENKPLGVDLFLHSAGSVFDGV